jgi:hypothetical protein
MHEIYNTCMSYVQSGVISFLLRVIKPWYPEKVCYSLVSERLDKVVEGCATVWYQSQGFDTEPRWASGVVFGLRMLGKLGLEGQFQTLVCSKVSRSYLMSFLSLGGIAALQNRSQCGISPQGERTPHHKCRSFRICSGGKVNPHDR